MTGTGQPEMTDNCWPADISCCEDWDDYPEGVQQRALALASSALQALSGYRVGGCPVTVRPCRQRCWTPFLPYAYPGWGWGGGWGASWGFWGWGGFNGWGPMNSGGKWINVSCGCTGDCSCSIVCEVNLPPPVGGIVAVQLGCEVLPETWYRVDNASKLVWQGDPNQPDMECGWPLCQDMASPMGADDTFSVTYLNSWPVDGIAAYAAGILACEFAKATCGKTCRLPPGVTQVTRQGVSYQVNPGTFPGGVTGIPEIDAWLNSVNPYHQKYPPMVWWPESGRGRVTTWSAG